MTWSALTWACEPCQNWGSRHKDLTRADKDQSAAGRHETNVYTALCRKFRSTDYDVAIDELQGIQTGHMQQHDGALRPHHNQVGKYLDGLSDYDGGQRLRSAIKIYVLGPIQQAKNNHMASGNGDAHVDPAVADSQAWGDMNDEQRGLLLDTAGSSMLDDYLKGTWLIYAYRWLAENDMLTNLYSAMSVGSHGIGDDWDYDKDKRVITPSTSSSSDDNDTAGSRSAKKKKKRRTGHQKPQHRSPTSQDRLTDSADKIIALIETATPAESRGAVGTADAAQANLLANDLAKSHSVELMATFKELEGSGVSNGMKILYGCRARKILADMARDSPAAETALMKAELDRLTAAAQSQS